MTDEELAKLMQEISDELAGLPETDDDSLSRKERKHRLVLKARSQALVKIREARKKGSLSRESRAATDYALLTEFGERNIFLYNLMKARMWYWPRL